jgi:hypothetical protein
LDRLARSMSIMPMLVPLQNPLIRYFSGLIFYLLLPNAVLCLESRRIPSLGLGSACGNADTKLPEGLTLKAMCKQ